MPLAPTNYMPQLAPASATQRRQAWRVWGAASAFMLIVAALIIAAPLAQAGGYNNLAAAIYRGFSTLCHQMPGRSFHLHAHPFAVCARCAGLYFGLAAGLAVYPLFRSLLRLDTPTRGWLILAMLPVSVDFLLGYTGLWANSHWSRACTGGLLGAVIAFYLVPGLLDLRFHWRTYFKPVASSTKSLATVTDESLAQNSVSDYSAPARRIRI